VIHKVIQIRSWDFINNGDNLLVTKVSHLLTLMILEKPLIGTFVDIWRKKTKRRERERKRNILKQ
jgi:hypothetical protein